MNIENDFGGMQNGINRPVWVRRLIKNDIGDLIDLYKNCGRDYDWMSSGELLRYFDKGEIWGMFRGNELCSAVPAIMLYEHCSIANFVRAQMPILAPWQGKTSVLLGPMPRRADFDKEYLRILIENCAARYIVSHHAKVLICVVPIKSSQDTLEMYFELGFKMYAIRPLENLRPHYILALPTSEKKYYNENIIIPLGSTHSIGCNLEDGFTGVCITKAKGEYMLTLKR